MRPRGGPRLPNENVYLVATAADLPKVLSQYVLYNLRYGTPGLYYSPDGVALVHLVEGTFPTFPAVVQGDSFYGSAPGVVSALPKDATATRYWANTGTLNNPKWDQVNLANGVTGNLAVSHLDSGTGASSTTFWRGDGVWATPLFPSDFTGVTHGLVPNPGGSTGRFLRDDATWVTIVTPATIYAGYVGADGTTGNRLPGGWSASKTATGVYDVTHSLGLADVTRLSVALACQGTSGNKAAQTRTTGTGNKFTVETIDSGTGTLTDEAFTFLAQTN